MARPESLGRESEAVKSVGGRFHGERAGTNMDFDTEHEVMRVATELFELAHQEMETEEQYMAAVDQAASEVLWRHPDFPAHLLFLAMGRALGRRECALRERMKGKR
jgi:hypothetical protein